MKTNLKKVLAAFLAISAVIVTSGCNIVTEDESDANVYVPSTNSSSSSSSAESTSSSESSSSAESSSAESSAESSSSTQSSVENDNPNPNGGEMSGSVLVLNDGRGIVVFGGGREGGKDYAETINKFKQKLPDVKFYSLVAPTAGSYYLPDNLKERYWASEKDNIDHINSFLSGITPVDGYTALSKHTNEDIYFRTDHHWTQLGAYYAAEEFAKVAGVPFAPLSEYEVFEREGYVGSLYGYSNENPKMKKNPDKFTFYKPKNNFTVSVYDPNYKYLYDMPLAFHDGTDYMIYGADNQINHVKTDCDNGRKLVIIGDSYDNALFLNLTNSFSEIWVCDMRAVTSAYTYFNLNIIDFIQKMGATDVLFNMDTFSAVGGNRYGLKTMLESANTLS